jgi:ADP-ribose pyrophosphatase YjhB (NUDIX family)
MPRRTNTEEFSISSAHPIPGEGAPVQPCAGGIVFDSARRLLVVLRGRAPGAGLWSIPGGRCLPGESPRQACVREVFEETGLSVRALRLAGTVQRCGPTDDVVYVIDDFFCELVDPATSGAIVAADDAAGVRWVDRGELSRLAVVPGLVEALAEWDALPD